MPSLSYDRLSALDNSFLLFEKPNSYTHVASTQIFEAEPLRTQDGGIDFELISKAHASLLHRIPRYRQILKYIPLQNHPVWVDDPNFNLAYHLRHTSLPKPGDERQLKRLSARIMEHHLDRSRPLWETWVVEGLDGDRFALISKIHHCMVDGSSGVDLMQILMTDEPQHEVEPPPPYIPRPAPSAAQLLRDELMRQLHFPLRAVRDFRSFVNEAQDARREIATRIRAVRETVGGVTQSASPTPINQPIGPHRRFDWLSMELGDIKEVRKQLGGSLNDLVLTVVTGAFRRFLRQRGENPAGLDFRVMAPVSVRRQEERGVMGNRVSAWIVELPLDEANPREQLKRITRRTQELKESQRAVAADVLTAVAEWTPSTLLSLGARNATRLLPFNTVVTNVPGPQVPMYMMGSQLLAAFPHVPLVDNIGIGIALFSYHGRLNWGVSADWDLVPDLHDFVEAIEVSFREIREAAGVVDVAPPPEEPSEESSEPPEESTAEPPEESPGEPSGEA